MRRILIFLITAALLLALGGCAAAPSMSAPQASAPQAEALQPAAEAPAELSPFVGDWRLCAQEGDIISATREELEAQAAESGLELDSVMSVSLRGDGTLSFCVYGMLTEGGWTDNGDGSGLLRLNGQDCGMNVKDGLLRVDLKAYVCVFEPGGRTAGEAAAAVPTLPDYDYQMPEEKPGDPALVGEWRFYDRDSSDMSLRIAHEDLPKLKERGQDYAADYTLSIGADGWFKATDFTGFERNTWTDNGDGTGTLSVDGETCQIAAEGSFLVLTAPDSVTRYERTAEVGNPMAEDAEDMSGVVLEKLAGDFGFDRYLVQAEDGETYACEYIGFEELAPGTEVTMEKWGRDWMIEPADEGSSFGHGSAETPAPLYTTKDGITLDDPDVRLAGGKVWSFSFTLSNPTGKDAEFDPSLFVLKRADGTELKTMAPYVSKDQVHAGTTYFRISITIGKAEAVKLGEEISFWYDGSFLGTVTAREF